MDEKLRVTRMVLNKKKLVKLPSKVPIGAGAGDPSPARDEETV